MSSALRSLYLLLPVFCLASCQSPETFKITLKDGREFISNSRPAYQAKTGYYRYKTFQQRDALLRADEVLLIEEQGV